MASSGSGSGSGGGLVDVLEATATDDNVLVIGLACGVIITCVCAFSLWRRCCTNPNAVSARDQLVDHKTEAFQRRFALELEPPERVNYSTPAFMRPPWAGTDDYEIELPAVYVAGPRVTFAAEVQQRRKRNEVPPSVACLQANRPLGPGGETMPASKPVYFEVTVVSKPRATTLALGWATRPYPSACMLGYTKHSIGFHSDTGRVFGGDTVGYEYSSRGFRQGDVVGCGYEKVSALDSSSHGLRGPSIVFFYTMNGYRLKKCPKGTFTLSDTQTLLQSMRASQGMGSRGRGRGRSGSGRGGGMSGSGRGMPSSREFASAGSRSGTPGVTGMKEERYALAMGCAYPSLSADGECDVVVNLNGPFKWNPSQEGGTSFYDLHEAGAGPGGATSADDSSRAVAVPQASHFDSQGRLYSDVIGGATGDATAAAAMPGGASDAAYMYGDVPAAEHAVGSGGDGYDDGYGGAAGDGSQYDSATVGDDGGYIPGRLVQGNAVAPPMPVPVFAMPVSGLEPRDDFVGAAMSTGKDGGYGHSHGKGDGGGGELPRGPSAGSRGGFSSYEDYQAYVGKRKGEQYQEANAGAQSIAGPGVLMPTVARRGR